MHVAAASLTLRGVAVTGRGGERKNAVLCTHKGRAELAGCALSSPGGTGLYVVGGASAEVQGGTIADCKTGVTCVHSGSKATVRTARPRTAETARSTPRPLAAFFARLPFVVPPVLWLAGTAAKRRLIQAQEWRKKKRPSRKMRSKTN